MTHDWGHWINADSDSLIDVGSRQAQVRWCLRCGLLHRRIGSDDPGHFAEGISGPDKPGMPGVCEGFPFEHDHRGHDMRPRRTNRTYIEGGPVYYAWKCARCGLDKSSLGASRDPVLRLPELSESEECGVRVTSQVMTS